jgi:hypothetical protein
VYLESCDGWFGFVLVRLKDGGGYACTLLTSMLESIEAEKSDSCDVFVGGVNPKDAASLPKAFQTRFPRSVGRDAHKF